MQEFLYYVFHPEEVSKEYSRPRVWIDWVFDLREKRPDGTVHRHLVEIIEGWSALRITVASLFPVLGSAILGIVWASMTQDVQTAFTVASFLLTFGSGK
ncbi:hypothetical protein B0T24DRAFT_627811 [Lasiosphaeria ovina]|uniref:Uncharacterized protein n=1 Tax=Lasiosphaeria ovina TaxID=92902 RepID=A0AAE0N565_9PEZI|nr:hypothetical protein B0T24DRAFT_627811 [Lasiosphaeria ovina]